MIDEPASVVAQWVQTVTGSTNVEFKRRAAGGSRAGYEVWAHTPSGPRHLWLRVDTGSGPQSSTTYTLQREADVYRALAKTQVKVAPLIGVHPTEQAFLLEWIDGSNRLTSVEDPGIRKRIMREFMEQLADLHEIAWTDADLGTLGPIRSITAHTQSELDAWSSQNEFDGGPFDLLIKASELWLRRNIPNSPVSEKPVLVQGDTGPGNFLFTDTGITGITDWELAHLGDFHDDLAWLYVRDLLDPITPPFNELLGWYEERRGRKIDTNRLRYYRVLAQYRCVIGVTNAFGTADPQAEVVMQLLYALMHTRVLADELLAASGLDSETTRDENVTERRPVDEDWDWLYRFAVDELRQVILPRINDDFGARRTKALARLMTIIQEMERSGPNANRLELHELENLMGTRIPTLRKARVDAYQHLVEGDIDFEQAVVSICRSTHTLSTVFKPALGSLAERHFAALPGDDMGTRSGGVCLK